MPRGKSEGIKYTGELFGTRLHQLRISKGMSIKRLSDHVGVCPTYISQLERGEKTPGFDTLIRIANFLRVTADELLCDYMEADHSTVPANIAALLQGLDKQEERDLEEIITLLVAQAKEKKKHSEVIQ